MYFTQRLATGFFGGEGFVLQRLVGDGLVLLKGGGATIVRELQAGEVLRVCISPASIWPERVCRSQPAPSLRSRTRCTTTSK